MDDYKQDFDHSNRHVVIVGGGLVGALNACFFAQKGWSVDLFEYRKDIRQLEQYVNGRSINLALSLRGIEALKGVDCEDQVLENAIPMNGRYVHNRDGKSFNIQKYGIHGEHIFSISRRKLNEILLTKAEEKMNTKLHFEHKLLSYNSAEKTLVFRRLSDKEEVRLTADLICGCDGAYSALRKSFMQMTDFDYSQIYIPLRYLELNIEPDSTGDFQMPPNYFHLWPRGDFCLIGLANPDKSFTITLMAPTAIFDLLKSGKTKTADFFQKNFPDASKMIGMDNILEAFEKYTPGTFISIKCSPHHMNDNVVLLGDAAHAMVPFYGQGMNAAFEDCLVFHESLDRNSNNLGAALTEYSSLRCIDAHAICDLAMYNYSELSDLVNHWTFRARKQLDFTLTSLFPNFWIPLYNMVTFSRIRYHEVVKKRKWQDGFVRKMINTFFILGFMFIVVLLFKIF